jgi:hypothetical protein
MTAQQNPTADLPTTRPLTFAYVLSLVIALFIAIASVVGILYRTLVYPTHELLLSQVPLDAVNLVIGLPVLLGSVWLAQRGKLIGLLCWPGALLYVLYIYITCVIGVPFGVLFLPHLLLVTLSAYTAIGLVASIDSEAVAQRLIGKVPARIAGGILFAAALLFLLRQIGLIITALTTQTPVDTGDPTWISDVTVLCPTWLVGGMWLWQRKSMGYTAGAGLLLLAGVLFIGAIFPFAYPALSTGAPVDVGGVVFLSIMGAICLVPFGFFVRGVGAA